MATNKKNVNKNNEQNKSEVIEKVNLENTIISEKNDLELENDSLKNEIEALKAQITLLINNANNANRASAPVNDDVLVISMCDWTLNLTTEPMGGGTIYKFSKFGEEQMIPRDDLKKIKNSNPKFTKEGLFYIADEEFIKSEKLSSAYSKILNTDSLINLLDSSKDNFEKVFKSLSDTQKNTFIDLVCKRLINNEDVDMNIVSICNKISKRNINNEVEQAKVVLELNK